MDSASHLECYLMAGLRRCHSPATGLWSYKYLLDGRAEPNVWQPRYDVFYSLNLLLSLSKVDKQLLASHDYNVKDLLAQTCDELRRTGGPLHSYGTAAWAAAEWSIDVPGHIADHLRQALRDERATCRHTAQEIGMTLSGVTAIGLHDRAWRSLGDQLCGVVLNQLRGSSDLFLNSGHGARRRFSTFASQVYCTLGLYHHGAARSHEPALDAADACVRALIALQGPYGEWPWLFDVQTGRVMDFYEVYSVHQHGMAPSILMHAHARGVPGAGDALRKGFLWLFGSNVLGKSMLRPDLQLIYRSHARTGLSSHRPVRLVRGTYNALMGRSDTIEATRADLITITPEMRSYEAAWPLWAFGGSSDWRDLTGRAEFSSSLRPEQPGFAKSAAE